MKRIILCLAIFGSAVGCQQGHDQYRNDYPSGGVITHASVEASIEISPEPAIDPAQVQGFLPAEQCYPAEVSINDVKVKLLGFSPKIQVVQRDTFFTQTWVSLSLEKRLACYLTINQHGGDLFGLVLPYMRDYPGRGELSFEDIDDKYGDQMIELSPDKIYVEPQFLEKLKAHHVSIPDQWEAIPEVDYSHIHDYTKP